MSNKEKPNRGREPNGKGTGAKKSFVLSGRPSRIACHDFSAAVEQAHLDTISKNGTIGRIRIASFANLTGLEFSDPRQVDLSQAARSGKEGMCCNGGINFTSAGSPCMRQENHLGSDKENAKIPLHQA
ncbi:hypothetical protein T265_11040 [Opisthorchis viverrini]|uniref:Uncharacterized protein n=1 Tax=Opisthorchis viverrini TaxID=6198 RepID=A0A074Z4G0_OPIVI|nr:hypothetical protein T265_11040 [Opisthorchis viverrini]KER20417.1 hypothetical protein T265_11040 [Opisthorchis viverrini]